MRVSDAHEHRHFAPKDLELLTTPREYFHRHAAVVKLCAENIRAPAPSDLKPSHDYVNEGNLELLPWNFVHVGVKTLLKLVDQVGVAPRVIQILDVDGSSS